MDGITADEAGFSTRIGRTNVSVRFGQIQFCEASAPGCVVALPANDLFDDECINDCRSALGAYIHHAFPGKVPDLQRLMLAKLTNENHEVVEIATKTFGRSYGVAKCIYLDNPFLSGKKIILVSVTTKRAGIGVRSDPSYLFAAMKAICREMNDHKLTDLFLPVFGAGHGGLEVELALLYILLSVKAVLDDRWAGTHLRSISIVVFQEEGTMPSSSSRDVIGRILAATKATI